MMSIPFDKFDHGRIEPLRSWPTVALDVARTPTDPLQIAMAGTLLWVSRDTDGQAYARFNDSTAARAPLAAGTVIHGAPFRRLFLDWEAQAGKELVLLYGTGIQIQPGNDVGNIQRIVEPVGLDAFALGTSQYFRQTSSAALNTVLSPASNLNGVIVHGAWAYAEGSDSRVMAKATAPTGWSDAAAWTLALARGNTSGGVQAVTGGLALPVELPAGLGIYEQPNTASQPSGAAVNYTVL